MITRETIRQAILNGIEAITTRRICIGDSELLADHDIDSLDQMSLMIEVEDAIGLDFGDLDPKTIQCIDDYVALVQRIEADSVSEVVE